MVQQDVPLAHSSLAQPSSSCVPACRPRVAPCRAHQAQPAAAAASIAANQGMADDILKRRFLIPADEVQQLLAAIGQGGGTLEDLLFSLIQPASRLARPPVSNYYVG